MLQVALKNDTGVENQIFYNHLRLKRFTTLTPKVIAITSLYSPERRRVERFIEAEFKHSYNAIISEHYPILMSVQDEDGNILGALGFRYADNETLFLEQYLDVPVAEKILQTTGETISRSKIVEVGNLASHGDGASIFLFTALTAFLAQQGGEIISVTATDFLHRYFARIGIELDVLEYADQHRLQDDGALWGSYYENHPRILTGRVAQSYNRLQRYLKMSLIEEPRRLQAQIHHGIDISE